MIKDTSTQTPHQEDRFEIGGEQLWPKRVNTATESHTHEYNRQCTEDLEEIRIRIGTLLKAENVSFLFGAGASANCGGPLLGAIPVAIEQALQREGIVGTSKPRVRRWLSLFYLAARNCGSNYNVPLTRNAIIERQKEVNRDAPSPLKVNYEAVLSTLYRWRGALSASQERLRIDGTPEIDAKTEDLDAALRHATRALAKACNLPTEGKEEGLITYKTFIRKVLTRPLNLKRINIFTLNYDTLVEQAADAEGVVLLDGFVGIQRRVFRPECYEQDLYFPAETTEGRVHRFDRVLHLYKLHGSITWRQTEPNIDNPFGVLWAPFDPTASDPMLIYPTPAKYGETLGFPYSEMLRRFAVAIIRPQSVLFVIGYGFGDEHVNAILRQALSIPSFTLVIVDPVPQSDFVKTLRQQNDRRIWIAEGPNIGTFSGFVQHLLPDLQDERIREKVSATQLALARYDML